MPWQGVAPGCLSPRHRGKQGRIMRTSYTVRYERDETGWWVAQVKEAPAAITQGRTIAEARRRIRESLALALNDDAAAKRAKLIDDVKLPADARRALEEARAARARLATESKKAQKSTAKAVRTLLESMHLSVRDAGDLIGISPQRVHQLAHENG
jgi:predicted RNase H-like HicB family nuclease